MLDQDIKDILISSKNIVVVGCSSRPEKAAHEIPKYLQGQGYKIIPINPNAKNILGERVYHSIQELDNIGFDIINIFRPSNEVFEIIDELLRLKKIPKLIWMQVGIFDEDAAKKAREKGIKVVMDKCIMVEHLQLKN